MTGVFDCLHWRLLSFPSQKTASYQQISLKKSVYVQHTASRFCKLAVTIVTISASQSCCSKNIFIKKLRLERSFLSLYIIRHCTSEANDQCVISKNRICCQILKKNVKKNNNKLKCAVKFYLASVWRNEKIQLPLPCK